MFRTKQLPDGRDAVAPDGSDVRLLLELERGGLAHFELAAGETSVPVRHRTVDEIWYFVSGRGEMCLRFGEAEEVTRVGPGVCVAIPVGTRFPVSCARIRAPRRGGCDDAPVARRR